LISGENKKFADFLKGGTGLDKENQLEEIFERLQEMLNSMKYGSITLIVQDGKIIQMERNEKLRIK
jgi:hypothetical protein